MGLVIDKIIGGPLMHDHSEDMAHGALSDMPDTLGTNSDHDARYYTQSSANSTFLKLDCSNDPLTSSLDIYKATEDAKLWLTTYGALDADFSHLYLQHSQTDTALTNSATGDNAYLGMLQYNGVNTGGSFTYGTRIYSRQTGAAGAGLLNAYLWLESYGINNQLGDNAGTCLWTVKDSDAATVASINSNGGITGTSFTDGVATLSAGSITGAVNGTFTGNLTIDSDSSKLYLGADQDAEIYHTGSNLMIDNNTGDIYISATGGQISFSGDDIVNVQDIEMGSTAANAGSFTMIMGGQTSDPQFSINLAVDDSGDTTLNPDTGSLIVKLADNAGAEKLYINDSDGATVFSTDSNGATTIPSMSAAGFVKNSAAGLLSGGNTIGVADITDIATTYLKIDTSNDPLTGNLEISKADPEYKLTSSGNSEYSRWTRAETVNLMSLKNRTSTTGGTSYDVTLDNGSHYGVITTDAGLNTIGDAGQDFTIAFWMYNTYVAGGDMHAILEKRISGSNGWLISSLGGSAEAVQFFMYDGSNILQKNSSAGSVTNNAWHRIVYVVDRNNTVTIYIDGALHDSWVDNVAGDASAEGHNIWIGLNESAVSNFEGKVDEILFFNTTKDLPWVQADYAAGAGLYTIDFTGMLAGYHFDEGSGTVDNMEGTATRDMALTGGITWNAGEKANPGTGTVNEINIVSSQDASVAVEYGINTYGDANASTNIIGYGGVGLSETGSAFFTKLLTTSTTPYTANRAFTIDLDNAARTLKLQGNLTVEAASLLNQDLTSDASPTFANPQFTSLKLNNGNTALSQLRAYMAESGANSFSILGYTVETYLGCGVYHNGLAWTHQNYDTNSSLLVARGTGYAWYASDNSSSSFNIAANVSLWNQAGTWVAPVSSASITDSGLTATRLTYATTGGLLTDSANFTTDGTDVTFATTSKLSFRDAAIYIQSTTDGWLNLVADTGVEFNAPILNVIDLYASSDIFLDDNGYLTLGTGDDMRIYYDGTSGNIDTDLVAPSDLTIDCGTAKTLVLEVPVYNDVNFGMLMLGSGGTKPGTVQILDNDGDNSGIFTLGFAVGEEVSGVVEVPHDYQEGSNLTFHIHWGGQTAPAGGTDNVKWQLTYSISRDGQTFPDSVTIVKENAITAQYQWLRSDFTAINGSTAAYDGGIVKIGDQFNFTIKRIAADSDEYGGEALVATAGFHYAKDTMGSRAITTK